MASTTYSNTLYIGSDNYAWLSMVDTASLSITGATVNGELFNAAGTSVQSFSMAYNASSDHGAGYEGTILAAVTSAMTDGETAQLRITATSPDEYVLIDYTVRNKRL